MRFSLIPRHRKRAVYGLYATSAALLTGSLVLIGTTAPASAAGTDWGPNGVMAATSSAVTVQWDGGGATPAVDAVHRDATQKLPYGSSKTYDDLDPAVRSVAQTDLGGMRLTVSQTQGLRHQAVNLSVTGADAGTGTLPNALLVMQCWGTPQETAPDPTHCQDGAGTVDGGSFAQRVISDPDQQNVADAKLKAGTGVTVYGRFTGASLKLTAVVQAAVFTPAGQTNLVTGGKGHVKFYDADRSVVADLPLSANGTAVATLGDPKGALNSYTAQYIAAPGENYLSSGISAQASNQNYTAPTNPGAGTNLAPVRTATVPFASIDGTTVASSDTGEYFTQTSTNEVGAFQLPAVKTDTASRTFEVQTGAEASGLGCGARSDAPSTSVCWLVAIPYDSDFPASYQLPVMGALSPSLWALRMQVQLSFAPVTSTCGGGDRELSVGDELLTRAMNSWIPAVCSEEGIDLGFVQSTDDEARNQYVTKTTGLIFTSQPVVDPSGGTSTLYAPVALNAVTISVLSIDAGTATPVTGIKLNARLIAKLLTQSYQAGIDTGNSLSTIGTDLPWATNLPSTLASDPEFKALNPHLPIKATLAGSDLIVTVAGTDATAALWNWIVHDPQAKSFLDGCSDTASVIDGKPSVINPFFSTRSYTECPSDKAALEATAASWRGDQSASNPNGTQLPQTYVDTVPSYPPAAAPFPQPGYYERPAKKDSTGAVVQTPLTLADLHPREATFGAIASDVFRGLEKSLGTWCPNANACPGSIVNPPGVWINSAAPSFGSGVLGVTDSASASADLLPTALLCNDSADVCVGANNQTLQASVAQFTPSSVDAHILQQGKLFDWTSGGYPITIPVYAEINTTGINATDANAYEKVLSYISGDGQTQGYDIGNLPPGMAPLTAGLKAQTASAIATLKTLAVAPPKPSKTPTPTTSSSPSSSPSPSQSEGIVPPINPPSEPPIDPGTPQPSQVPESPSPLPTVEARLGTTPASAIGPLPGLALAGLIGALLAGVAAPIIGRPRKVRR